MSDKSNNFGAFLQAVEKFQYADPEAAASHHHSAVNTRDWDRIQEEIARAEQQADQSAPEV